MATRSTIITSLGASGIANIAAESHTATVTLSGDSDIVNDTQDIGLTSELISLGEITAGGAAFVELENLDETNFISFGFENPAVAGTKTFHLGPGESTLLAKPSAALYAIADTGIVKIGKRAVEA